LSGGKRRSSVIGTVVRACRRASRWGWSKPNRLLLAALAAWRDHARARRRDIDKPGWVPWSLVLVLAMLLAVVCGAPAVMV
jgi:hypothetical protein